MSDLGDAGEAGEARESARVYLRLKRLFGGAATRRTRRDRRRDPDGGGSMPFTPGREPRGLGQVMDSLTAELGWTSPLAQSELIASWPELVGEGTAEHSSPAGIEEGVLTVRCESTAWATQLRLMRAELFTRIAERFPDAGIETIRFQGPDVPSWKRGPRSIPGRGPRDTYG
jgi:predicted nucleic acid-binding Zn ribbon protein